MRASIAQCLINIDNIDVLLLDEPTNHRNFIYNNNNFIRSFLNFIKIISIILVDLGTIFWLQQYLQELECIVVIVSHDR